MYKLFTLDFNKIFFLIKYYLIIEARNLINFI